MAFGRKQILQPRVVDLNAVVEAAVSLFHRLIGEDIAVQTRLEPDLRATRADPVQMEQVLLNLAINARDAMPRGGQLTVRTANVELDEAAPGAWILLEVADTGVGMDSETLARIFEPFFTTKPVGVGTGLGLSTVYGIIRQHGGHIVVESAPAHGSVFRIYLPRVAEGVVPEAAEADASPTPQGSETILVAEDEAPVRNLVRDILQGAGYTVLSARNGREALELAERHDGTIHLLLTDVVMPSMSGDDLAQHLVRRHPGTRVLYVSGYPDRGASRADLLRRGDPLLEKPFTVEQLKRAVRDALAR